MKSLITDDQVRKHRELRRQRDEWQTDVDRLAAITGRLRNDYARHKGDFAVGRYEELKTMVKTAVAEMNDVLSENKDRRQTPTPTSGRHTGAITTMRTNAASFAVAQGRISTDERIYSEMSPAQLSSESEQLRRQIISLKQDFRSERERLEHLHTAYAQSKKLNPAQRYAALKEMIKEATVLMTQQQRSAGFGSMTSPSSPASPSRSATLVR